MARTGKKSGKKSAKPKTRRTKKSASYGGGKSSISNNSIRRALKIAANRCLEKNGYKLKAKPDGEGVTARAQKGSAEIVSGFLDICYKQIADSVRPLLEVNNKTTLGTKQLGIVLSRNCMGIDAKVWELADVDKPKKRVALAYKSVHTRFNYFLGNQYHLSKHAKEAIRQVSEKVIEIVANRACMFAFNAGRLGIKNKDLASAWETIICKF